MVLAHTHSEILSLSFCVDDREKRKENNSRSVFSLRDLFLCFGCTVLSLSQGRQDGEIRESGGFPPLYFELKKTLKRLRKKVARTTLLVGESAGL